MACALYSFWYFTGRIGEGRRWLEVLSRAGPLPPAGRARATAMAAILLLHQGDRDTAVTQLKAAKALADRIGHAETLAYATQFLGLAALLDGDPTTARRLLEEALARHRGRADPRGESLALLQLAILASLTGDPQRATPLYEQTLQLCDRVDEADNRSYALWALGFAAWQAGRHDEAEDLERRSLHLRQDLDDRIGMALTLDTLAWIATSRRRQVRAARLLGAAAALRDAIGVAAYEPFRAHDEQCRAQLTDQLGAARLADEYHLGRRLDTIGACALALQQPTGKVGAPPRPAEPARPAEPVPLSRRERQVADLVAAGMSNKEIARRLTIAQRTAENHVEHILTKLGLTSRAQVAAWAVRNPADRE
jgi:non-specific serine/threonine protein kinase